MSVALHINYILTDALKPVEIQVVDQSHLHAGHAGARPEGETHFQVIIVSSLFAGKSLIERHRMVNDLLFDLLRDRVHALSLKAYAPGEPR
ncbi:MAG: BolA family transcriptional regulator [Micavibrio aeruginosavorus]|uniref:BolA family transcriptional regulator n=1 Tax=Micavibrio aeruginosavorus TaxID=349221 RepID=A0A7T5UHI2_9BACT|nr:MAG: BolA family transcriptional regulator [Micavibrio aeruginosavorus]